MRIYSSKTYIIVGKEGGAHIVGGEELRHLISAADLVDGDRVFEAQLFAMAREKRQIELVDAAGELAQLELGEPGEAT